MVTGMRMGFFVVDRMIRRCAISVFPSLKFRSTHPPSRLSSGEPESSGVTSELAFPCRRYPGWWTRPLSGFRLFSLGITLQLVCDIAALYKMLCLDRPKNRRLLGVCWSHARACRSGINVTKITPHYRFRRFQAEDGRASCSSNADCLARDVGGVTPGQT